MARIPSRPFEKLTNPLLNGRDDHKFQNGYHHKNNEENKFSQNYAGTYQNDHYKGQTNKPINGKLVPDIKLKHGNSANTIQRVEKISPTKLGVATRTASTKPEDNKEGPPDAKKSRSFFRFLKIFNWGCKGDKGKVTKPKTKKKPMPALKQRHPLRLGERDVKSECNAKSLNDDSLLNDNAYMKSFYIKNKYGALDVNKIKDEN